MNEENKMGVMPVGKLLASMAIPMMISMLVQALYNVVDSIFVAQIGENSLTAVSLAFPLQNLLIAFGVGTAVGMNALLSRSLGEKKQDMVDRTANTGMFLFFCNAVFFALVGIFLVHPFFMAQTHNQEIVESGTAYATIVLTCSIGLFGQFYFERLLQSTGRTGLSMVIQLIGAVINLILDPILIFGLCGFPRLEVVGAAVATVIGQLVSAAVALFVNLFANPEIHLRWKLVRWDSKITKEIYRVAVPSIVMSSVGSVMTFGLNKIVIGFSTTAAAVLGAYFKLQSFVFMPIFGLNNGMVPILAYNYGAGKEDRLKKTITCATVAAILIMTAGMLIFELFPQVLLGFFDASENMLAIGIPALRIVATHFFMAGFSIVVSSVCQAVGNPMHSLITSVCRQLLVLLPIAWLLAQSGDLNLVWLSFPIAEVCSVILSAIFLVSTMKRVRVSMAARRNTAEN